MIRLYSNFIQCPVRDLSAPIYCFLSVNISIVGPQGPIYLHQPVKLKWVVTAQYKGEAHIITCKLRNQTLYRLQFKLEPNKAEWIKTQPGVTVDGIIIDKYLKEEDEGVYRCTHAAELGQYTYGEYNLTASGKSAQ